MSQLTEKLEVLDPVVKELFEPPFKFSELIQLIEKGAAVAVEVTAPEGYEPTLAVVKEASEFLKERHQLIRRLDDLVKAGLLEPFDGAIIEAVFDKAVVPLTAKALAKV